MSEVEESAPPERPNLPVPRHAVDPRRAIAVLGEYWAALENGWDPADSRTSKKAAGPGKTAEEKRLSCTHETAERESIKWERKKITGWRRAGRLTPHGALRVISDFRREPWTLRGVGRAAPWLNKRDRVALLIELDGIAWEGFMSESAKDSLRVAIEKIVDHRIEEIISGVLADVERRARVGSAASAAAAAEPHPGGVMGHQRRTRRRKRVRDPKTGELVTREELENRQAKRANGDWGKRLEKEQAENAKAG